MDCRCGRGLPDVQHMLEHPATELVQDSKNPEIYRSSTRPGWYRCPCGNLYNVAQLYGLSQLQGSDT